MRILLPPSRRALLACALALGLFAAPCPAVRAALAQANPESAVGDTTLPGFVGYVNDYARLMSDDDRAQLEGFLDQVEKKTGVEFALLTMPSTAPYDPSEYKTLVFQRWKLGKRGKDNGVLLLIAVAEHKIWFETGYGIEGTLPDNLLSRIIAAEMTPRFRANDWTGGIEAGVLRTCAVIAKEQGVTLEWNGKPLRYTGRIGRKQSIPVWWIALVVFIIVLNIVGGRGGRRFRGGWYVGPGTGGWGGGWGGGFGGGGGGGGGGGFGGFGGGSSGGGGGGGSW